MQPGIYLILSENSPDGNSRKDISRIPDIWLQTHTAPAVRPAGSSGLNRLMAPADIGSAPVDGGWPEAGWQPALRVSGIEWREKHACTRKNGTASCSILVQADMPLPDTAIGSGECTGTAEENNGVDPLFCRGSAFWPVKGMKPAMW